MADLEHLLERDANDLCGGEMQRFAIGLLCVQHADMYVAIMLREKWRNLTGDITDICLMSRQATSISDKG